ncbi:MAG: IPT/TIG domain-containing protein [Treponema sp.]|nr:IPT/TIG domain-containing protein [Treponema sp.]
MDSTNRFSYLFRKSALFRWCCIFSVILCITGIILLVSYRSKAEPVIDAIVPPVGSPGDVIVINGKHFGDVRDMSYVEFAGSKLTASSYISWNDTCIKLVLPSSVQNGLVVVGVKGMVSEPALFANEIDIPVPVTEVSQGSKPVIASLSTAKANIGDLITINGNNFGDARNQSKVLFSINYNQVLSEGGIVNKALEMENMIEASEFDGDYEYWSNSEIRVRVPDGAYSGVVIVDTGKEKSEPVDFTVVNVGLVKNYTGRKIYLIQYTADVADVVAGEDSTISLRCPLPEKTAAQPEYEITEITPAPILQNYQNCLIHQITKKRNNTNKTVFVQNFVLPVYEVSTSELNVEKINSFKAMSDLSYKKYTMAEANIPCDNEAIIKLAAEIIGKEKNTYRKAKRIYDYMCKNYKILNKPRSEDSSVIEMLETKEGDAYDFAVMFVSLMRSAGLPAVVDSGVLIKQDLMTQSHWWCEFYVPSVGWIPVDIALGAGLEYKAWDDIDVNKYYFGNMDNHHILFSRGWNNMKPFAQENKIVHYPRSFALQNIWEEASASTVNYSSYWGIPVIKGLY